jgi:predicted patatin/cPLA2 family phospholipase
LKLGIVMEGGASRTVFSCGVADCLLEEQIMPDYFIGVSAGIAYGVSYLSGQKGRNLQLIEEFMSDKRYMGIKYLFNRKMKSFYNIPFVFDEVPNKLLPFDYEAFAAYKGEAEAVVTNIKTGKAEYFPVPRDNKDFSVIMASCSLPILFQPVKIGKKYYLDGGVSDSIPFQRAFEKGCDKVIVVLTRTRDYVKKAEKAGKAASTLYHRYPKLVESLKNRPEAYNQCIKELRRAEKAGKVFVLAPEDMMGVGRTEASAEKLRKLYQQGYYQTKESMHALRLYLEEP